MLVEYKSDQYNRACEIALCYGYKNLRYFQYTEDTLVNLNRPMIIVTWLPYDPTSSFDVNIEGNIYTFDMSLGYPMVQEPFFIDKLFSLSKSLLIGYYLES